MRDRRILPGPGSIEVGIDLLVELIVEDIPKSESYPDHSLREGVELALTWLAKHGYYLTRTDPE